MTPPQAESDKTWERERSLVLYRLDELMRSRESDSKLLKSIESKLISYQASVRTLKWVAATTGAGAALVLEWVWRLFRT